MTTQTNETHSRQPDIEVYIKDISVDAIISWLNDVFVSVEKQNALGKASITLQCKIKDETDIISTIPVTIFTGAAGKLYTSLWFQSDKTPWSTDIDCAIQLVEATGNEVRCSTNGWEEAEDADNQWWKVTAEGKTIVNW
jgi:hypothetical protein